MAYKQYPTDKYLKEVQQKLRLLEYQKPIIDKYYTEVRAKIKPTIEQLPENPNEGQIRNYVINELSPILKNQTVNFVENLMKANDLMAFYKFGKTFLNEVKDIRNLDSSFLADLWSKYKSKMLIYAESNLPKTGLTPTEYENALKHNRRVASSRDLEYPEIVIEPPARLTPSRLNRIVVDSNYGTTTPNVISPTKEQKMSVLEQIKEYPTIRTKKQLLNKQKKILLNTSNLKPGLYPLNTSNLEQYPKGTLSRTSNVEKLAESKPYVYKKYNTPQRVGYTKTPRLYPATNSQLKKEERSGFSAGRPPKLTESNLKQASKKLGSSKSSNPASATAASAYQGNGLRMHPKFIGRGIPGITVYARR